MAGPTLIFDNIPLGGSSRFYGNSLDDFPIPTVYFEGSSMCDCVSYNRPHLSGHNGRKEVVLPAPPQITDRPNGICIDACIVDAIQMLWNAGVETLGCCCGHNRGNPSLVIPEHEDAARIKRLLAEHDSREWDVMQWRLVKC
jgi:hypothetical protein